MAKAHTTTSNNGLNRKIIFSIFVFIFLIYGNSIRNGFAVDDRHVTVTNKQMPDNPRVAKGIRGIPEIFSTYYVQSDMQSFDYRPLPLATFAIEYQFFGSNPNVNHFFNVLIYAGTCALLFLVLLQIFKGYNIVFSLVVTFLFIAHPVHTEVVDNIKCRDELLAFFFGILSLYYFLKAIRADKVNRVIVFKIIIFLVMALLCKKTAILFIGLVLLTVWFFTNAKFKKILLFSGLLFSAYVIYFVWVRMFLPVAPEVRNFTFYENPLYFQHSFLNRVYMGLATTGYYFRLLVFPYPLCFYYGYNAVPVDGPGSVWLWISLVVYAVAIFYVMKKIKQKNILTYGILVFMMGLVPFANLFFPVVGILGERFIYFSSFGFCIAAAYLLMKLFKVDFTNEKTTLRNMNPVLQRSMIVILVIFSALVITRNTKWKDLLTLSQNDVAHFDNSYMLHAFVANNLNAQIAGMPQGFKKQAMIEEAKIHFSKSGEILSAGLKENEEDYFSMTTLGTMYSNYLNRPDDAILLFKKSLAKNPDYEVAQYNLYYCYELKGLTDSAISSYESMIAAGTKYQLVFLRLHELYLKKNQFAKAINNDKSALQKYPDDIKSVLNLGNDYILSTDTIEGLKYFKKAAAMAPSDKNLLLRIAEVFRAVGRISEARDYEQKATRASKN